MFIPIQFILAFEIYDAIRSNMIDNIKFFDLNHRHHFHAGCKLAI